MSAESIQWPEDDPLTPAQTEPGRAAILNVMVRWLERHARVWVGTRSELLGELRGESSEAELPVLLNATELLQTIELSIEQLRSRGIQAEIHQRPGSARLITLRLSKEAPVLPLPSAAETPGSAPSKSDSHAPEIVATGNRPEEYVASYDLPSFRSETADPDNEEGFSLGPVGVPLDPRWVRYLKSNSAPIAGVVLVAFICGSAYLGISAARPKKARVAVQTRSALSVEELKASAEKGDARAQYELAVRYREGDGVPKDNSQAMEWLRKSAMQHNATAQFVLGNLLTETDIVVGYSWIFLAGFNGSAMAGETLNSLTPRLTQSQIAEVRLQIGRMFASGTGVSPDNVAAYTWYELARQAGSDIASKEKLALEAKMSRAQIAEGRKRASAWTRER